MNVVVCVRYSNDEQFEVEWTYFIQQLSDGNTEILQIRQTNNIFSRITITIIINRREARLLEVTLSHFNLLTYNIWVCVFLFLPLSVSLNHLKKTHTFIITSRVDWIGHTPILDIRDVAEWWIHRCFLLFFFFFFSSLTGMCVRFFSFFFIFSHFGRGYGIKK